MVDVLDLDRALLDAGTAGDAVPDHLLGDAAPDQRGQIATRERDRPLRQQLVADAHDQELGRQHLPGRPGGADVLAAAALRAREGVHHLLPRHVGHRAGAEAHVRLGDVLVEAERLEPTARPGAAEEDVDRGREDVQVLRIGQVDEEAEDDRDVRPHEHALEDTCRLTRAESVRDAVRDRRPAGRPLVQAERDPRRMPEHERRHDPGDQRQDQVGLTEVTALEAGGTLRLADQECAQDTDQDEHGEQVDHEREPALAPEPGQRRVAVDRPDQRDQDRRQEDEKAPEDDRVQRAGDEALEQLPLAEHDLRLCAQALRQVVEALDRLAAADEPPEQPGTPREERARDGEQRRQRERGREDYVCLVFLISAEIAGRISCRSPITA